MYPTFYSAEDIPFTFYKAINFAESFDANSRVEGHVIPVIMRQCVRKPIWDSSLKLKYNVFKSRLTWDLAFEE